MLSLLPRLLSRIFRPYAVVIPALSAGLLLALAFPPLSYAFVGFFALVPLFATIVRGDRGPRVCFKAGYMCGVAFFTAHLWWIVQLVPASSITLPWLMAPALVILVAYLSLYPALACLLFRLLAPRGGVAALFLLPALWTLVEVLRSSGELGFPWGAIGYSLVRYPVLLQVASLGGVFALSGLVVLVNATWALAVVSRARPLRLAWMAAGFAIILTSGMYGSRVIERHDATAGGRPAVPMAIAQPNVDLELKWKAAFRDSTQRLVERLVGQSATLGARLAVFPETSAPVFIHHHPSFRRALAALAVERDTEIFIGFLDGRYETPGAEVDVYNSSGLFNTQGMLTQYDKMHLLPFGEAIPFAWRFRALKRLDFGQANFHPGEFGKPVPSTAGRLGPLICFEAIFPGLSRRAVAEGADVLVNITNDGWFGDTPGPFQHAEMAILRAVENRRYLLRSANSGVSMVVDPVGRVVDSLGLGIQGILFHRIEPGGPETPYTRLGDAPLLGLCAALLIVGAIVGRVSGVRAPRGGRGLSL